MAAPHEYLMRTCPSLGNPPTLLLQTSDIICGEWRKLGTINISGSNSPADVMLSSSNQNGAPAPPSRPSPPSRPAAPGPAPTQKPQESLADTVIVPQPVPKLRGNPLEVREALFLHSG